MDLSQDDVHCIISQKLALIETEELTNKSKYFGFTLLDKVLESKFGKKLESKCADLTIFTEAIILLVSIVNKRPKLEPYYNKLIDEGTEMFLKNDTEKENHEITEAILTLRPHIFPVFGSAEDKKNEDVLSKKGMQELKIVQRCSAYYILALYAYIDVYLDEYFEKLLKKKIPLEEREKLDGYPKKGGIKDKTKFLLKVMGDKLPEQIDGFYFDYKGINDKAAFDLFLETRNSIAHANPLPKLEKLRSKFRKQYKKAKEKKDYIIDSIVKFDFSDNKDKKKRTEPSSEMKKAFTNILNTVLKDIHLAFLFMEISQSCIKYLAIIEEITQFRYGK